MADMLSHQMESKSPQPQPDPILPSFLILAPILWNLMDEIQRAHAMEAPPDSCPPAKLYEPVALCL